MTPERVAEIRADFTARVRAAGFHPAEARTERGYLAHTVLRVAVPEGCARYAQGWGVSICALSELLRGKTHTGAPRRVGSRVGRHLDPATRQRIYDRWVELGGPTHPPRQRPSPITTVAGEFGISRNGAWEIINRATGRGEQRRAKAREGARRRRATRLAAALCERCGKPAQDGYRECYTCRIRESAWERARHAARKAAASEHRAAMAVVG